MEKGYIHLKGALTRDQVAGYLAATDEVVAQYREIHSEDQLDIILAGIEE